MNSYTSEAKIEAYKEAVEQRAGGKFYVGKLSENASNMVNEIKETKTTLFNTSKKTYVTDHPEVCFISVVVIFAILKIIEKRIKL